MIPAGGNIRWSDTFKHVLFAIGLAVLCYAAYFNALHNDFMVDDHNVILWDYHGHNPDKLSDQFLPGYRDLRGIKDLAALQYFRPWAHIIPLASYAFFQQDPFGYHAFNLLLWYLACLSLYFFLYFLFKDRWLAGLTALVFAVHPINGLMVNYITASVFSFEIIMMMLAMATAVKYLDDYRRWWWFSLSVLAFLNALFCHETALAFPFYVLCYLWILKGKSFRSSVILSLPFWLATGVYFVFRLNVVSLHSSILENIFLMDINIGTYLATMAKLMVWYVQGLLTFQNIVLIKSVAVTSTGMIWWILGLIAILAAGIFVFIKWLDARERFAMVWFVIGFLPSLLACFFQYKAGLILEPHWLVTASIGYFLLMALILLRLKSYGRSLMMTVVIVVWLGSALVVGWSYNRLWGNEVQYCLRWMKESPTIRPIPIYLAHAYVKQGDLEQAKIYFSRAIDGSFFDYEVLNDLGAVAMQQEQWSKAKEYFQRALILNPSSAPVYNNLGVVYFNESDDANAEKSYRQALLANPYFMDARRNLSDLYISQGRWSDALMLEEESLGIDPFNENVIVSLIDLKIKMKFFDNIDTLAQRLIKSSQNAVLVLNMAVRLAEAGQTQSAGRCFQRVLQIDPGLKEAYIETGKFLGNAGHFEDAIMMWEQGRKLFPADSLFSDLIHQAQTMKAN